MSNNFSKKPDAETFRRVCNQCAGNISQVAKILGVNRSTVDDWRKNDSEFRSIIRDERMKMFDECVITARMVALGVKKYDFEYDDEGNVVLDDKGNPKKKMVGWEERPDGNMLRYMMSTLGRTEGFGESPVDESDGTVKSGVPIRAWIMKMNQGEE